MYPPTPSPPKTRRASTPMITFFIGKAFFSLGCCVVPIWFTDGV
jgi:hypothetical protein